MKNFRTLDQAKKDLQAYVNYIQLIEAYEPKTLTEYAVYIYAHEGNVARTADKLNDMFVFKDRPFERKDVTALIQSKPAPNDLLHREIRRLYKRTVAPPPKRFPASTYFISVTQPA